VDEGAELAAAAKAEQANPSAEIIHVRTDQAVVGPEAETVRSGWLGQQLLPGADIP
jgi:hypothetical protein